MPTNDKTTAATSRRLSSIGQYVARAVGVAKVAPSQHIAAELPVICTPNTGSVVRDGMDGVIVPAGDADAVTSALARLADSHEMRRVMAQNARQRADGFDLTAYGDRLIDAMGFTAPGDPA